MEKIFVLYQKRMEDKFRQLQTERSIYCAAKYIAQQLHCLCCQKVICQNYSIYNIGKIGKRKLLNTT